MTDPKHLTLTFDLERQPEGASWRVPHADLSPRTLTLGEVSIDSRSWTWSDLTVRWAADDEPAVGNAQLEIQIPLSALENPPKDSWIARHGGLAAIAALVVALTGGSGVKGCQQTDKIDQLQINQAASLAEIKRAKAALLATEKCGTVTTHDDLYDIAKACAGGTAELVAANFNLQRDFNSLVQMHKQSNSAKDELDGL